MWVFGSAREDFLKLHFAGLLAFALVWFVASESYFYQMLVLLTLVVLDSGHMYSTIWRTHFNFREFRSNPKYWQVPLGVFLLASFWVALRIPYLFNVVLYLTVYHHMRQYYGVTRWYEKLAGRKDRPSHFFIQVLFIVPFMAFHFRPHKIEGLFGQGDMFFYPSLQIYQTLLLIYVVLILAWCIHEIRLYRQGQREWGRVLSIFIPMSLTGFGTIFGQSTAQVILPLVATHSFAYFALMTMSMRKIESQRWRSPLKVWAVILFTATLAGSWAYFLDNNYVDEAYQNWQTVPLWLSVACGVSVTPTVCHYIFDSWIWSGRHHDAALIYGSNQSR